MLRRLPISLRFDDEEADFYFGFIEQKKNDRELSSLILNLLHVYYENELVRASVDDYIFQQNPYMKIHDELQRIALEHNRQSVSTGMLNDYTLNAKKQVENVTETPSTPKDQEDPALEEFISWSKEPNTLGAKAYEEFKRQKQLEQSDVVSEPVIEDESIVTNVGVPTAPEVVTPLKKGYEPSISSDVVVPPKVTAPKVVAPIQIETEIDENTAEVKETTERTKPKSFGKLLHSVK